MSKLPKTARLVCLALLTMLAVTSVRGQNIDDLNQLLHQFNQLYGAGKYSEAEPVVKHMVDITRQRFGENHPAYATSLHNLGVVYYSRGRYNDAIALYTRALAISEKVLGPEHPDVARTLIGLAAVYQSQKRYDDAIPLLTRSLSISEKTLGPDHPYGAFILNNLAITYDSEGRYSDALKLYTRALAIKEKALGPSHPDVASTLTNLAAVYRSQARYSQAIPLLTRALAIYEKARGPNHPDVADILYELAETARLQRHFREAIPLYERALAIREKTLGLDHLLVAQTLRSLANAYYSQGHYGDAIPLLTRALPIFEKALGADGAGVADTLNDLAETYRLQGRYADAAPLYTRALVIFERVLGPNDPEVAKTLNNLAIVYRTQGQYREAIPLYMRALAIREKALGPDHPDVAHTLSNLANVYQSQNQHSDAIAFYMRALAINEKALGRDDPGVAIILNNLAAVYLSEGRYAEALPLCTRALAIIEKTVGPDHPDVAETLTNLAAVYQSQGRYRDATPLYTRALAIREKALGPDHPHVGQSLDSLAALSLAQNDLAGAAGHWRRATEILQRRAALGLGGAKEGSGRGEAQRSDWQFSGLVKVISRLGSSGRGMFETAQWAQGSEAAAALAQMAARYATGEPALVARVRERQDLVAEWEQRDGARTAAAALAPDKRNKETEAANVARLEAIDKRLGEIDAELKTKFPDYAALASPRPIAIADVQGALADGEALVLFLDTVEFKPLPEETFVWVVTKSDVRWLRSDLGTKSLKREVAALRCGLDATAWSAKEGDCPKLTGAAYSDADRMAGKPLPFDAARAHALYKGLLGEAEDLIKGKHLLVVLSGALTTLPFLVLVTKAPTSADLASASWLIRDHAISVLPSVASLAALRRTGKPSAAPKPMIGFGNPLLDGNQGHPRYGAYFKQQAAVARTQTGCAPSDKKRTAALRVVSRSLDTAPLPGGRVADPGHLRIQAPLPETADELCAVARSVGGSVEDVRIGARATENEVKRLSSSGELAKYRILHFATHGTLAGQLSGTTEPGLILTPPTSATEVDDGFLAGSEIAALKLDADWVILSACNTAGGAGEGEAAEALSGLARVFFYAGARALLVSHWEVDSDAAVKLVTGAIGALAKDKSLGRAEAMRRAMLAVMADSSRPADWVPAWHPSVWAPFVVVGEGGAGS